MTKEERNALVKCVIMGVCAAGWLVFTYLLCIDMGRPTGLKLLALLAAVGWVWLFAIRASQWDKLRKSK